MEEKIINALQSIGLTQGEVKVYLALTSLGGSRVGPIIEKSGVSASKSYMILERLFTKGLVSVTIEQGIKHYKASDPGAILSYLEDEQSKLSKNMALIESMLPLLKSTYGTDENLPIIEMAWGRKGFQAFHLEFVESAEIGSNFISLATSNVSFAMQGFWFKFSQNMSKKKINQFLTYEDRNWNTKNPEMHKRKERTLYYPRVIKSRYADLPHISCLGDNTIITDLQDGTVFSLMIRHKGTTQSFKKLLTLIYDSSQVPEGFKEKELII